MGLPSVNIIFQSKAIAAMKRGAVGILALVLKDSVLNLTDYRLQDVADIPDTFSATNQTYLEQAFMGTPKEIRAIVIPAEAENYNDALNYLETIKFNIMSIPGIDAADVLPYLCTVTTVCSSLNPKASPTAFMILRFA